MSRRNFSILLALAAVARLPMLFDRFWYDENFTLALVRLPFDRMLAAIMGDVHPPLFYIFAWLSGHWGGPAWLIRIPSLLASLLALVVFREILYLLEIDQRARPVALILMAFAPLQLHYGSEARMYALLELEMLIGVLAFLTFRWWLVWLAMIAMLYTHNWGLIYTLALAVVMAIQIIRDGTKLANLLQALSPASNYWREVSCNYFQLEFKELAFACGSAFLIWLPWAFIMHDQMGTINQNYWIMRVSPGQIAYYIFQQVWSVALPNPVGFMVTWAWLALGIMATWKLIINPARIYLLAFLPLLIGVLISLIWQPVVIFRALIGTSPFIYIILAAPFVWIYERRAAWHYEQGIIWRRALLAAIFIAPLAVLAYPALYDPDYRGNNSAKVVSYLQQHIQPADLVVVGGDGGVLNLRAYGFAPIMIPECAPSLGSVSDISRTALDYDIRPWQQIHARRIWLYWGTTPLLHQCEVDEFHTIVGDSVPLVTDQVNEMTFTGLWLVEGK